MNLLMPQGWYEFTGITLWYEFTGNCAMVRIYCDLHLCHLSIRGKRPGGLTSGLLLATDKRSVAKPYYNITKMLPASDRAVTEM